MHAKRRGRMAGFSLIEVLLAMFVFCLGGLSVAGAMGYSLKLDTVNRETALATQEIHRVLEEIRGLSFEEILASYDTDPADDPLGYGTAPGGAFEIDGLTAPDGLRGGARVQVFLPLDASGKVTENLVIPALGTLGDLNADGKITGQDVTTDLKILPVAIRIDWRGPNGDRTVWLHTVLRRN